MRQTKRHAVGVSDKEVLKGLGIRADALWASAVIPVLLLDLLFKNAAGGRLGEREDIGGNPLAGLDAHAPAGAVVLAPGLLDKMAIIRLDTTTHEIIRGGENDLAIDLGDKLKPGDPGLIM
jgi:hypothetical protein